MKTLVLILILAYSPLILAKEIRTNAVTMNDAPSWLKTVDVNKAAEKIESKLEWTIRRIPVYWYKDQKSFEKVHSLGSTPSAVSIKSSKEQSIHLGPQVNKDNFSEIFTHELVHIIFYQKYKEAIPRWLEEGFANHLSKTKAVDYKWLSQQKFPNDIRTLQHPYVGSPVSAKFHYKASQALVEMLDKKCNLENLVRLSVERNMEDYIKTFCEIGDINLAFKKWVKSKS